MKSEKRKQVAKTFSKVSIKKNGTENERRIFRNNFKVKCYHAAEESHFMYSNALSIEIDYTTHLANVERIVV